MDQISGKRKRESKNAHHDFAGGMVVDDMKLLELSIDNYQMHGDMLLARAAGLLVTLLMILILESEITRIPRPGTPRFPYVANKRENLLAAISNDIHSSNPISCQQKYGMHPNSFLQILEIVRDECEKTYRSMQPIIQLAIFLDYVTQGTSLRDQSAKYCISLDCIHKSRMSVMYALVQPHIRGPWFRPPELPNLKKSLEPFQGVVGCIDCSHFEVCLRKEIQPLYRNRKQRITINCFFATDLDTMKFFYVGVGAPGSSQDKTVFHECRHNLLMDANIIDDHATGNPTQVPGQESPRNLYFIADAGFPLQFQRVLVPYRKVRRHVSQFPADSPPTNSKELFNCCLAKMRNIVERALGVFKNRFQIFRKPIDLDRVSKMNKLILSCVVVHNILRSNADDDSRYLFVHSQDRELHAEELAESEEELLSNADDDDEPPTQIATAWRDSIAETLWSNFSSDHLLNL